MALGRAICLVAITGMMIGSTTASAHSVFKKELQKKYVGMKVSCNACHVKKKPKSERSEFGKLFQKELQKTHADLTKSWKSKKGADKKDYEKKTMIPAFKAALKIVKVKKNDKGEAYDDLIKNEKVPEIKKDPKYKPEESAEPPKESGDTPSNDSATTSDDSGKDEGASTENGRGS